MQFLVLQDRSIPSVPHLLRGMLAQREFGGLAVHWRVFGSSGHLEPPQAGVLQVCTPLRLCWGHQAPPNMCSPVEAGLCKHAWCSVLLCMCSFGAISDLH